jgi:hypothetical protein
MIGRHFEPQPIRGGLANELRYSADDIGSNEPSKPIRIKKIHSHLIILNVIITIKHQLPRV